MLHRPPTEQAVQSLHNRYTQLWPEIQQQTRALAMAYAHLAQPKREAVAMVYSRHQPALEVTAAIWLKENHPRLPILADAISCGLIPILRNGALFEWKPDLEHAAYRLSPQPPSGSAEAELRLVPGKLPLGAQAQVLGWMELMTDHLVDTWLALQGLVLSCSPDDLKLPLSITPDQVLATCLRAKSHYAYTKPQRDLVRQEIQLLAHLHLHITVSLPNRSHAGPILSPLLRTFSTPDEMEIALGDWIGVQPAQWRQVIKLPRELLKLHPEFEQKAKRIGLHLLYLGARQPSGVDLTTQELLQQAGIILDQDNPKRTRDGMIRALKLLAGLPVLDPAKKRKGYDEPFIWDSREHVAVSTSEAYLLSAFWAIGNAETRKLVELLLHHWVAAWRKLHWHFVVCPS